ncbi:LysR family transcriptional regulator [Bacillus sp. FJAT-27225]|uniref:LysR family transcriptional regulator n=1 Tax=Bacillus sp. FJAT-27225 TaxID=1743144 RepID=UPI000980C0A4|nr:LysR family transcriptional regulator [Bacillus sp. FJAT-27225]
MSVLAIFQYEVFLAVVDNGSFTKAGEKLGLSQSGVSHNISTLEAELGMVLLHRNRNGISLTDAGVRVISHIRQIVRHANLLEQEAALIKGFEIGSIKIGSFPSFSSKIFPSIIRTYVKMYPHIQIELYEGGYDDIKNWLTTGTIDIGFLPLPANGFETIHLFTDKLALLVHRDHRLSTQKQVHIKSLHNEPFIMPKAGCDFLIKDFLKKSNVQPTVLFEVIDNNTIISMVQEKLGITIISEMILSEKISNTKVIPLEHDLVREIGMALKSIKQASPAVKRFIEITRGLF